MLSLNKLFEEGTTPYSNTLLHVLLVIGTPWYIDWSNYGRITDYRYHINIINRFLYHLDSQRSLGSAYIKKKKIQPQNCKNLQMGIEI